MLRSGIVVAALCALVSSAHAEFYAQAMGGATFDGNLGWDGKTYATDAGFNYGAGVGMTLDSLLGPEWAVQGDFLHTHVTYECCRPNALDSWSGMADMVYFAKTNTFITPYAGLGIGAVDTVYHNAVTGDWNGWNFGWQGFAGFDLGIFRSVSVFAEYRYQGTMTGTVTQGALAIHHVEDQTNSVSAGVRVHI